LTLTPIIKGLYILDVLMYKWGQYKWGQSKIYSDAMRPRVEGWPAGGGKQEKFTLTPIYCGRPGRGRDHPLQSTCSLDNG